MSLREGLYIIESKENGATIGRNSIEDKSALPKRVVIHSVGDGLLPSVRWLIKPDEEGTYILEVLGGFAIAKDKALWADILGDPATRTKWKLEHQPQHGNAVYTISLPGTGEAWRVDNVEPGSQLAVGPLIVNPSLPPRYPPSGIFTITPLLRD